MSSFLERLKQKQAENNSLDWKQIAFGAGILVYLGGLMYAGVRSLSLFQRTIDPAYFPLAVLGVLTMEITAAALPLSIHYGTAPGRHRNWTLIFYGVDLLLVIFNAILDAAHQAGNILPAFMTGYNTYGLPALPILCMIGWSVQWLLDPAHKHRDTMLAMRKELNETLMEQIGEAIGTVDVSETVRLEANNRATALVTEMLESGRPHQKQLPAPSVNSVRAQRGVAPLESFAADVPEPPSLVAEDITGTTKVIKAKPAKN